MYNGNLQPQHTYYCTIYCVSQLPNRLGGSSLRRMLYVFLSAPTKFRSISGLLLSNSISCKNRSNRNTFKLRYPASRQRNHRCLFFSNRQLVMALGMSSVSASSVTAMGCIDWRAVAHPSPCPFITFRLSSLKSEYRRHTPTVFCICIKRIGGKKVSENLEARCSGDTIVRRSAQEKHVDQSHSHRGRNPRSK